MPIGKRDYALLLTLYNTGARISEILTLRQHQLAFGATSLLHLKGKGRKERECPLWPTTSRTLRTWVTECGDSGDRILFPSARGGPLSTDGATYILQQAVRRALPASPALSSQEDFSPRHSPHHGHAPPSIRSRNRSDCSLAWPPKLGHHSYVHPGRSQDQRTGAREVATSEGGFPVSGQTTRFWLSCRRSDYAEHTQDSMPAPLSFTRSTRHNPELGIRP